METVEITADNLRVFERLVQRDVVVSNTQDEQVQGFDIPLQPPDISDEDWVSLGFKRPTVSELRAAASASSSGDAKGDTKQKTPTDVLNVDSQETEQAQAGDAAETSVQENAGAAAPAGDTSLVDLTSIENSDEDSFQTGQQVVTRPPDSPPPTDILPSANDSMATGDETAAGARGGEDVPAPAESFVTTFADAHNATVGNVTSLRQMLNQLPPATSDSAASGWASTTVGRSNVRPFSGPASLSTQSGFYAQAAPAPLLQHQAQAQAPIPSLYTTQSTFGYPSAAPTSAWGADVAAAPSRFGVFPPAAARDERRDGHVTASATPTWLPPSNIMGPPQYGYGPSPLYGGGVYGLPAAAPPSAFAFAPAAPTQPRYPGRGFP